MMRISLTLGLGVATALLIARPLLATAAERKAFSDAVAVWHFKGVDDAAGANSALKLQGAVEIGRACEDAAMAASLERGGDGYAGDCAGGFSSPAKVPTAN